MMYKIRRFSKDDNSLSTAGKVTAATGGAIGVGALANAGYASHNLRKSINNLGSNVGFLSNTHKEALKGLNETAKNTSWNDYLKMSKSIDKNAHNLPEHVRSSNNRAMKALKHTKLARTGAKIAAGTALAGGLMYGAGKLMNKSES